MRKLLYILLLFPLLASGQTVVNLSPDSTLYDLHMLPPSGVVVDTTVYFVDAVNGDDSRPGYPEDSSWQTITKVVATDSIFEPGDSILFNRGDTWRYLADWDIDFIGEDGNNITIGNYGSGDRPRILGSDTITNWVDLTGNVWVGVKAAIDTFPSGRVFFEELTTGDTVTWGIEAASVAAVDAAGEYYFANDSVYIYSTSDPSTAFFSVEIAQVNNIIEMQTGGDSTEYITYDGLELAYGIIAAIRNEYPGGITGQTRALRGIEARNLFIHHMGEKNSAAAFGLSLLYSDMIIEDDTIGEIGRRGISIVSDGSFNSTTLGNDTIRNNYAFNGYHTTFLDINNVTATAVYSGFEIYGNTVEDDSSASITDPDAVSATSISHGIFLDEQAAGSTLENLNIYNNTFINPKGRAIQVNNADTTRIHHNSVYGGNVNMTSSYAHFAFGGTQDSLLHQNNISYITVSGYRSVQQQTPTTTTMDYNLFFTDFPAVDIFWYDGTGYNVSEWAAYKAASGWETNSPTPADPLFNNPYQPNDSLYLRGNSPGVGAGVALAGYTVDKDGVTVSDPPNIGAFEDTIIRLPGFAYKSPYYTDTVKLAFDTPPDDEHDKIYDSLFWMLDTITDGGAETSYLRKCDLMYLLASHDADDSRINVADTGNFTLSDQAAGLTFTQYNGWLGNAAGAFDTEWDPTNETSNYVLDDAHIAVFSNHNYSSETGYDLGVDDGANDAFISVDNGNTNRLNRVNTNSTPTLTSSGVDSVFIVNQRTASNAGEIFIDGSSALSHGVLSQAMPDDDFYIFCRNIAGSVVNPCSRELSFVSVGESLTVTQNTSLYTVLTWWRSAMGF